MASRRKVTAIVRATPVTLEVDARYDHVRGVVTLWRPEDSDDDHRPKEGAETIEVAMSVLRRFPECYLVTYSRIPHPASPVVNEVGVVFHGIRDFEHLREVLAL